MITPAKFKVWNFQAFRIAFNAIAKLKISILAVISFQRFLGSEKECCGTRDTETARLLREARVYASSIHDSMNHNMYSLLWH